jgi:hypothetical protein
MLAAVDFLFGSGLFRSGDREAKISRAMTGSRSYRLWLPAIGLLLVVAFGLLAYGQLTNTSSQSMGLEKLTIGGDTARRAFVSAAEMAAQWQQDARLAGVSGQQLAAGKRAANEIEWGFQFFSPSTQQLALVAVSGGKARMARSPALTPYPVSTFASEEWHVDSDQALQAWWERGGASLVAQNAQVDVMMQLRVLKEKGNRPVWTVAGAAAGTNTTLTILVDAGDGAIVGPD